MNRNGYVNFLSPGRADKRIMLALIAIAVAVAAPNVTSAVVGVFSKASSVMNK